MYRRIHPQLLTGAFALGMVACSASTGDDPINSKTAAQTGAEQYYYLHCNATGWQPSAENRLQAGMGTTLSLTYEVGESWMQGEGDDCTVVVTDAVDDWGDTSSYLDVPAAPVMVGAGGVSVATSPWDQASDYHFDVFYDELGTHTATFEPSTGTLSFAQGSGRANPSWKVQVLVYPNTDVGYTDTHGDARHFTAAMSDAELSRTVSVARNFFESEVSELSSGLQRPTVQVDVIDAPVSQISRYSGDCYRPDRPDVLADIDPSADSVVVFWDGAGTDVDTGAPVDLMHCAAGLASHRGIEQTYAVLQVNWWYDSWRFENDLKHEWGHSILFYHGAAGASPAPEVDNHQATQYVNCKTGQPYVATDDPSVENSYYHLQSGFTHDYYSGEIALASAPNVCIGIGNAWSVGGPVNKNWVDVPLPSAGFEQVTGGQVDGWNTAEWGSPQYAADSTLVHEGSYAARITGTDVDARYITNLAVQPDTLYRLSGWVRTEDVVCQSDGGGAVIGAVTDTVWPVATTPLAGSSDGYQFVDVKFNSGEQTSVELQARLGMFGNTCSGTAHFDALQLERAD